MASFGGEEDPEVHPSLHQQFPQYHPGLHLSRLSMCTKGESSIHIDDANDEHYDGDDDYDDDDDDDDNEEDGGGANNSTIAYHNNDGISPPGQDSDDDKAAATTPRWRWRWRWRGKGGLKESYASENEAQQKEKKIMDMRRRGRGIMEERPAGRYNNERDDDDDGNNRSASGESECLVITRPKGGRRPLCMDLEEMKACKELGFELDRISLMSMSPTYSPNDYTSSGGNSPIASWRISSPGDDPREVKARLKTWAQMVALATHATRL